MSFRVLRRQVGGADGEVRCPAHFPGPEDADPLRQRPKCEPDSQGRILIPAKLRQYAALEREVIINGASKCLELWNPERWAPIEDAGLDPENLAAAMEELGF